MSRNFSLENEIGATLPSVAFDAMKEAILGPKYELTLIISDKAKMKKLNTIYRDKEFATDILSFPISDTEGEIYLCPEATRKESKKFDRKYDNFMAFLFIHGCVHLKGYDHSSTMESIEAEVRAKFDI